MANYSVAGLLFFMLFLLLVLSFNLCQEHFESSAKTALWRILSCLDMEWYLEHYKVEFTH